jgi:tetratricopeptide (TPR) repeat protein
MLGVLWRRLRRRGLGGEKERFRVMDIIELVEAIRWPVAVLLLFIFFCLLFRTQIKSGLESMSKFRFRGAGTEVSVDREVPKTEAGQKEGGEEKVIAEEKTSEKTIETKEVKEPVTAEDWAREMFIAFMGKDIERGKEAYKKLQECESNVDNRLHNEAWYYYLLFSCGDTSALKKLEELVQRDGIAPAVQHIAERSIGLCYEKAGEFNEAEEAFKLAAEISSISESERAVDQVSLATCLFKNDKKGEAFDLLMREIAQTSDESALAELYEGLANICELLH